MRPANSLVSAFGAGACLFFVSGCSTMSVDKAKVGEVKQVSLVGFDLQQQMPPSLAGVVLGTETPSDGGLRVAGCENTTSAAEVLKDLGRTLAEDMKWKVIPSSTVTSNAVYREVYETYTKGFQLKHPTPDGFRCYTDSGILDPFSIQKMDMTKRRELLQALGVDALATATVEVRLENQSFLKKLVASGDLASVAVVKFRLYNGTDEDPFWVDVNAKGEETQETTSYTVGVFEEKPLHEQAVKAARTAIQALVVRYREAG